jgi:hypothetical protein
MLSRSRRQGELRQWRQRVRVAELRRLAELTRGLNWSSTLFEALLEELHLDDLFVDLVGDPKSLPRSQYPRAIAVALALRHSWRPDDLSHLVRRLKIWGHGRPARRTRVHR